MPGRLTRREQAELHSSRRTNSRFERSAVTSPARTNSARLCQSCFSPVDADTPTTVQAIKAGAQDFLTKPVSSDQLLGTIERALLNHQAERNKQDKLNMLRGLVALLTSAGTGGFRTSGQRTDEQANRGPIGDDRTHDQSPPSQGDGENEGSVPGRARLDCGTHRHARHARLSAAAMQSSALRHRVFGLVPKDNMQIGGKRVTG